MKKILLALILLGTAWPEEARLLPVVVVVLSADGPARCYKKGDIASRATPLQPLTSLKVGQTIELDPKAAVTVSVLASGMRYRLTGPLTVPITTTTPFQAGKGVVEVNNHPGRAGLAASQQVDMSKIGGSSGRKLGFPVYTDGPGLVLDLDVLPKSFESSSLKVFYRLDQSNGPWTPVESSLYHHSKSRDQLRLSAPLEAEKDYRVYIGDQTSPSDDDAQFLVRRLPKKDVEPVLELEKSATDWPAQIELFYAYWHLRLFAKAEGLLQKMRQQHPTNVDWTNLTDRFEEDRRSSRS